MINRNDVMKLINKSGMTLHLGMPHEKVIDQLHKFANEVDLFLSKPILEHVTDGSSCWCNPTVDYIDPETGNSVIVHNNPH